MQHSSSPISIHKPSKVTPTPTPIGYSPTTITLPLLFLEREKEKEMENGGNLFCNSNGHRGHNGNNNGNNNLAWDIWELGTSRFDWNSNSSCCNAFNEDTTTTTTTTTTATTAIATASTHTLPGASAAHALMFPHLGNNNMHHHHHQQQQSSLYGGGGAQLHPDPHLMCLKLGKRHYFEDATSPLGDRHVSVEFSAGKRGRPYYSGGGDGVVVCGPSSSSPAVSVSVPATVPRCQVEGCHVALVNAKDYHRRHKVCEMHSKAPKVVVHGQEQRFCQQCSRFHAVSEFDDSKRSCRRRLAGHNERRRKNSHESVAKNPSQDNRLMVGRYPYLSSPTGRALSLLSSKTESWVSPADLSSRSSAALRELIAENRAAILARQIFLDRDSWHWHHHATEDFSGAQLGSVSHVPHQHQLYPEPPGWVDRFHETDTHVTLDLMQAPSSAFGFLSVREKSKEEAEECSELWNSLEGAHVV
ncbi:hypothetical protein L1049_019210 [Liquidambar formosana]|uniref:SBP-type domain-containing protein n=1 Tax=Liquidambar formosana TaxID=63359 RepID=A0AAP0RCA4_LIQFO